MTEMHPIGDQQVTVTDGGSEFESELIWQSDRMSDGGTEYRRPSPITAGRQ